MQIMHFINRLFCSKISNSWHNNVIFDFLAIRFDSKYWNRESSRVESIRFQNNMNRIGFRVDS